MYEQYWLPCYLVHKYFSRTSIIVPSSWRYLLERTPSSTWVWSGLPCAGGSRGSGRGLVGRTGLRGGLLSWRGVAARLLTHSSPCGLDSPQAQTHYYHQHTHYTLGHHGDGVSALHWDVLWPATPLSTAEHFHSPPPPPFISIITHGFLITCVWFSCIWSS